MGQSAGVPAVATPTTDLVNPLRQAAIDAICHAIGGENVEIFVDRNWENLNYRLRLRVGRYNRVFDTEVTVGYVDLEEAMRLGKAGDVVGQAVDMLVHQIIAAFAKHLKSLGLR